MTTRQILPFVLSLLLLALAGCTPEEEGGSPDGLIHAEWDEDDDDSNDNPGDPEPVDAQWTGSVTIHGEAEDCDYDYQADDGDWPWEGDEDWYELEVPADGYLEATLSWDNSSQLDMVVFFDIPPGYNFSPDEILYSEDDESQNEYLFPVEHEEEDLVLLAMLCRSGGGGAYDLVVEWDD